jgi:tetratricopeptide (TPR) repeat protein
MSAKPIFLTVLLLAAAGLRAQEGGDIQAQILYAFQTEDSNSLRDLIQNLTAQVNSDGHDVALRYHLAHAQYRFGELSKLGKGAAAAAAFSDCIDELKPALDATVKSAEVLLLQSACYAELADLKTLEGVVLRSRAAERLKQAAKLAPRNPRIVLMSALAELNHAKPGTPERQRAFTQLQSAAQLFEATSATSLDTPGWGHAEAYMALSHELQLRGDHLGARNWIEKALIAAPDYKAAQRQLAALAKP